MTQKNYPDSTSAEYTYDLVGKILQANDPTGSYAFAYDNMGRLIGTTITYSFLPNTPFTNSYSYDADSDRTGYTPPDGSTNTYSYDTLNRLTTLPNSWPGSFGFSYDSLSRLLSVLHQAGGSTIDGAVYTLDAAGNRTAKTDDLAGITSNYTYDKIYELTQVVQGANTTESYSYDPVGNRQSSLGVPSYTVNSSNELTSNSSASYTYDNNGNTTSKSNSSGTTSYAWDFENRLTSVTLPGSGGTVTFKYDPFGRRIEKVSPTATSIFVYDGPDLVETVNGSGSQVARYAQGPGIDQPLAMERGDTTDYYEQDGVGSVTSLTASTGSIAQSYTYDSFGNTTNSTGSLTNFFRYTGREYDTETSLYYYRARYYDSSAGRFVSEDPMSFSAGLNFYPYVQNDPVNLVDPFGACKKSPQSPQCTAAQRDAAALAVAFGHYAEVSSGLALGSWLTTALSGGGEIITLGLDTPVTIGAGSLGTIFSGMALATGGISAGLNSYASGNSTALTNFSFTHLIGLAAKPSAEAAASRFPGLRSLAEPLSNLAEHAAGLATKSAEACQ